MTADRPRRARDSGQSVAVKRVLAVCCLALAGVACGDSYEGDVAASTTESDASTEADLVDDYVDALNRGNVEAALRLRCAEAQMEDPASEELFATQVDRLVDTAGPIEVVSVGPNPSSGLEPLGDGEHARAVRVELAGRKRAGSEPLEMVVLEQDDELRLCGVATASASDLHSDKPAVPDLGPSGRTPEQMMPADPGEGDYEQVLDGPTPEPPPSAAASWSRAWQEGGFGGINVAASQFSSSQEALDYAEQQRDTTLSDTTDVFTAGGGLGLRHLGYAWVWSQPPSVGDHIDEAILLFDDTVVTIKVTVDGSQDHQRVQDLAAALNGVANN
jgi:hypothetical protein